MSQEAKAGQDIPVPEIKTDKFQVMPPLENEEYQALKESIKKNGIQDPVHVDENGNVIEGHQRADIADELGINHYDLRIHPGLSDREKRNLAYALNMQERHLSQEQKRELIEQYLLEDWDPEKESLRSVGRLLGVSPETVRKIKNKLSEAGKLSKLDNFPKEEKRSRVFEYIADHPDASNRKVADAMEFDISHATVGNWRNELEGDEVSIETDEEGKPQVKIVTDRNGKQAKTLSPGPIVSSRKSLKKAKEVVQAAEEDPEKYGGFVEEMAEKKSVSGVHRKLQRERDKEKVKKEVSSLKEKGEYRTILIDPPWNYEGLSLAGRGAPEYKVMDIDDLEGLPLPKLAAEECHLYLWTTNNFLPVALDLIENWEFEYKTILTWVKPSIGLGSYFRNSTEHCLFAIKGDTTTLADDVSTHFEAERGEHSEKPEKMYEIIEKASSPPYLEMFARNRREGWDTWGVTE